MTPWPTAHPVEGKCIAWPGISPESAQAAHNAAHKTANVTIVVYFQRDTGAARSTLVMADSAGAAGGFAISVTATGAFEAYLRGSTGTAGHVDQSSRQRAAQSGLCHSVPLWRAGRYRSRARDV